MSAASRGEVIGAMPRPPRVGGERAAYASGRSWPDVGLAKRQAAEVRKPTEGHRAVDLLAGKTRTWGQGDS
jgi:hypothetical protein